MQRPTEDRFLISRSDLENRMAVLMGGRAAEQLIFGEVSTGAADDLDRAKEIAREMVTNFGMDGDLGQLVYEPERTVALGDSRSRGRLIILRTRSEIHVAIRNLVKGTYAHAIDARSNANAKSGEERKWLENETLTPDEYAPLRPMAGSDRGTTARRSRSKTLSRDRFHN